MVADLDVTCFEVYLALKTENPGLALYYESSSALFTPSYVTNNYNNESLFLTVIYNLQFLILSLDACSVQNDNKNKADFKLLIQVIRLCDRVLNVN